MENKYYQAFNVLCMPNNEWCVIIL